MREQFTHRRRFLQVLGAASTGFLAGCSTGVLEDQPLSSQSSTILDRLPRLEQQEYRGKALTIESFVPEKLTGYEDTMAHLQTLDRAVPWAFDIDIRSMAKGFVALDGMIVSLTVPSEQSFSDTITNPGTETGSVGSYTVYEHNDGLLALDGNRLLFVRPDDRVTIDTREVLERVVDAETGDSETAPTDHQKVAADTVKAVDTDHLLSVVVPFNRDVFGDETRYLQGVRAVAWGLTVDEHDAGRASIKSKIALRFPSGEVEKGSYLPYIHERKHVWVDILTTSVEGGMVTAHGESESLPNNGESPYLRPRGLSDALHVRVRSSPTEWIFDYPNYGITGAKELMLPVDRTTVIRGFSSDGSHRLDVLAIDLRVEADSDWYRYATVTPSETGEYRGFCRIGHEDTQEHTATVRVVDTATFEEWLSSQ